jgi:hypothetical protein
MKKNMILILSAFLIFSVNSCTEKEKSDDCSILWATELQAELMALSTAAQNFGSNPNLTTCNAYKNAAQAYVDALAPYGDCAIFTTVQRAQWQAALEDAQADVDAITCSEFQ